MEAASSPVPADWVPVDQRWLGLDRRHLGPTLVVVLFAILTVLVIPALDRAVPAGREIPAGAVVALNGRIEFTPAAGWSLVDGALLGEDTRAGGYPASATVIKGPTTFTVTTANFDGTPAELLTQVESTAERTGSTVQFTGEARTSRTSSGLTGLQTSTRTATTAGLIAVFVADGTGVKVSVNAPARAGSSPDAEVRAMVESIAAIEGGR